MTIPNWFFDQLKKNEGFKDKAYWDHGQWSIGYGSKAKSPTETIDRNEADRRLLTEVADARRIVDGVVPPDAPEGAKLALTSLTHNAGPKWVKDGLGELARQGDWPAAAARLQLYTKSQGQTLPGLVTRRAQEADLMTGRTPLPANNEPPASLPTSAAQPAAVGAPTAAAGPTDVSSNNRGGPILRGVTPQVQQFVHDLHAQFPNVRITSGHRSEQYNADHGGVKGSQHIVGKAIDADLSNLTTAEKGAVIDFARQNGAGGLGNYGGDNIHIDFRQNKVAWGPDTHSSSIGRTPDWFRERAIAHMNGQAPPPRPPGEVPTMSANATTTPGALGFAGDVQGRMPGPQQATPGGVPPPIPDSALALKMTPQETNLYKTHQDNLTSGAVVNPGGRLSTLRVVGTEIDGRYYNVPSVWDGKLHSPTEAVAHAKQSGLQNYPSYANRQQAEARYNQMHTVMEADTKTAQQSGAAPSAQQAVASSGMPPTSSRGFTPSPAGNSAGPMVRMHGGDESGVQTMGRLGPVMTEAIRQAPPRSQARAQAPAPTPATAAPAAAPPVEPTPAPVDPWTKTTPDARGPMDPRSLAALGLSPFDNQLATDYSTPGPGTFDPYNNAVTQSMPSRYAAGSYGVSRWEPPTVRGGPWGRAAPAPNAAPPPTPPPAATPLVAQSSRTKDPQTPLQRLRPFDPASIAGRGDLMDKAQPVNTAMFAPGADPWSLPPGVPPAPEIAGNLAKPPATPAQVPTLDWATAQPANAIYTGALNAPASPAWPQAPQRTPTFSEGFSTPANAAAQPPPPSTPAQVPFTPPGERPWWELPGMMGGLSPFGSFGGGYSGGFDAGGGFGGGGGFSIGGIGGW